MTALVRTTCCDLHGVHCEPPGDLCCVHCTEAFHGLPWWYDHSRPIHSNGTPCVFGAPADPDPQETP
jgi:hypothetical protein